jgi:PTH1 family peptidyl-tRNA hydrolase
MNKKIIIGLGNPGQEYERTRHNCGFLLVQKTAIQLGLKFAQSPDHNFLIAGDSTHLLILPQLFMNRSGEAVASYLKYYKLLPLDFNQLYLCYDDLDLKLGNWKVVKNSFPKVHNGVNSVIQHLGHGDFWHVRMGIDARDADNKIPGPNYVLEKIPLTEVSLYEAMWSSVIQEILK